MSARLPDDIRPQVLRYHEFRMGVLRIGVELADGRSFDNVLVSGLNVTRVLGYDVVPFEAEDVIGVTDQSELALPPGY